MTSRPPLDSLVVFEACARHSSFTRAAAELAVTPAAVSARIRDFEHVLGVKLFHRSGPQIALTESGTTLAARATAALGELRAAVNDCRSTAPTLRVSCVPSIAIRLVAPRIAAFLGRHQGVTVSLDVSAELREPGSFDVAVRTGNGGWKNCEAVELLPILSTPMLSPAMMRRHRPRTPDELKRLPLLPNGKWPRWFEVAGASISGVEPGPIEFSLHELNAVAAAKGAGVALLSPILYAELVESGALVQPFPVVIEGPGAHHAVVPTRQQHPAAGAFVEWLKEMAKECISAGKPSPSR